jgi:hypothetical protein
LRVLVLGNINASRLWLDSDLLLGGLGGTGLFFAPPSIFLVEGNVNETERTRGAVIRLERLIIERNGDATTRQGPSNCRSRPCDGIAPFTQNAGKSGIATIVGSDGPGRLILGVDIGRDASAVLTRYLRRGQGTMTRCVRMPVGGSLKETGERAGEVEAAAGMGFGAGATGDVEAGSILVRVRGGSIDSVAAESPCGE